jgi:hypothetical protein
MEKKPCCETPTAPQPTKLEFLEQKLRNFRAYLEPFATTDAVKAQLNQFQSVQDVLPFLAQLLPVYKAGQLTSVVDTFAAEFPGADDAFKAKVARYLECFAETLAA